MPRPRKQPSGTLVLLVRHGQTPTTGSRLPGRAPGLHLADAGVIQAEAAAARIAPLKRVAAVYTSPLERTRETAAPIAKAVGVRPRVERGLLECDFGEWTGADLKDLRKKPEWKAVQSYPSGFRFPGGESFAEMQLRMTAAIERLCARHCGSIVVVVSHADPIKAAVAAALGTHLDLFQRIVVSPCSVTVIVYAPTGPLVLAVNSTGRDLSARAVMSSSFDLSEVDHFTAGTIGPTGQRVFYVQARGEDALVTLRLEKQQVAALADYLGGILDDLPAIEETAGTGAGLLDPVVAEWVVGSLGVAWDEQADRVVLVAEELLDEAATEAGTEPATARFRLTRGQVSTFVETARELVAAGRPPCPICGRPLNPEGHTCPRSNGHGSS